MFGVQRIRYGIQSVINVSNLTSVLNDTDLRKEIKQDIPVYLEDGYFIPVLIITFLGILGNLLTLLKIVFNKAFHRTVFIVIGTIIFTDIVNLFLYLLHAGWNKVHFQLEKVPCATFLVVFYGVAHACAAHVVFLFGLRFYMVVEPIKFGQIRSRWIILSSISLWVVSGFFSIVYYLLRYESGIQTPIYVIVTFRVYLILVPSLLIVIFHVKKIHGLKRTLSKRGVQNSMIKMSFVTSVILFCYMSSAILFLVCYIFSLYRFQNIERELLVAAQLSWLLNAVLSPFIYFIAMPRTYKCFIYIFTWVHTILCSRSKRRELEIQ
ncbi:uncharacterized protein LOC125669077 [Ostrea edulis]|uniref:uncharacterized protein LOC125669077 n=1 Tax=Ostrea edulis TaxID=37623 RepID=UPI002094E5A6|nr:uncharacterized protein LOC125669077 [Ostrea edulis]